MKFKGKPIENSLKLPPCQFSDVYSDKKGGKRRQKMSNRTRKGGSSNKNVSFEGAEDIHSIFGNFAKPTSILNFKKTETPSTINPSSVLDLLEKRLNNHHRHNKNTKSILKKRGGRNTKRSNKSKRKTRKLKKN